MLVLYTHVFLQFMQKQFSELLMKAASDYGALTASMGDFQWSQNFKEPPSVWGVCFYVQFIVLSLEVYTGSVYL